MKRKVVLAFLLTGALVLSGCSKTNSSNETSSGSTRRIHQHKASMSQICSQTEIKRLDMMRKTVQ